MLPEFKDDEDQKCRLFRRAILNLTIIVILSVRTQRIGILTVAFMDVIIMQIVLAEVLSFNIPVSVSLNEYVEIAKLYSTPKSGGFINGTLMESLIN